MMQKGIMKQKQRGEVLLTNGVAPPPLYKNNIKSKKRKRIQEEQGGDNYKEETEENDDDEEEEEEVDKKEEGAVDDEHKEDNDDEWNSDVSSDEDDDRFIKRDQDLVELDYAMFRYCCPHMDHTTEQLSKIMSLINKLSLDQINAPIDKSLGCIRAHNVLTKAIERNIVEVVSLVLDRGANVEVILHTNHGGRQRTPLLLAAYIGNVLVVCLLLNKGANIHAMDCYQSNALMLAAQRGHFEVVVLLLDNRADIHAMNRFGYNALMNAALNGHADVVCLLLERGADIQATDHFGVTALMNAAKSGHVEVVNFLLEKRADTETKNNKGQTAAMLAANNNIRDTIVNFIHPSLLKLRRPEQEKDDDDDDDDEISSSFTTTTEAWNPSSDTLDKNLKSGLRSSRPKLQDDNDILSNFSVYKVLYIVQRWIGPQDFDFAGLLSCLQELDLKDGNTAAKQSLARCS